LAAGFAAVVFSLFSAEVGFVSVVGLFGSAIFRIINVVNCFLKFLIKKAFDASYVAEA